MNTNLFFKLIQVVLLLAIQVVVFNRIHLMGYVTPIIIGYILLDFSRSTSRIALLLWGFFVGLIFDIFSNTAGMASASCTFLGLIQPKLQNLLNPRDAGDDFIPTIKSMGFWKFFFYAFFAMLTVNAIFYALDAFTLHNWQLTLIAIGGSTLLSSVICIIAELTSRNK